MKYTVPADIHTDIVVHGSSAKEKRVYYINPDITKDTVMGPPPAPWDEHAQLAAAIAYDSSPYVNNISPNQEYRVLSGFLNSQ